LCPWLTLTERNRLPAEAAAQAGSEQLQTGIPFDFAQGTLAILVQNNILNGPLANV